VYIKLRIPCPTWGAISTTVSRPVYIVQRGIRVKKKKTLTARPKPLEKSVLLCTEAIERSRGVLKTREGQVNKIKYNVRIIIHCLWETLELEFLIRKYGKKGTCFL
jgi:hypothetical protein